MVMNFNVANWANREIKILATKTHYTVLNNCYRISLKIAVLESMHKVKGSSSFTEI